MATILNWEHIHIQGMTKTVNEYNMRELAHQHHKKGKQNSRAFLTNLQEQLQTTRKGCKQMNGKLQLHNFTGCHNLNPFI